MKKELEWIRDALSSRPAWVKDGAVGAIERVAAITINEILEPPPWCQRSGLCNPEWTRTETQNPLPLGSKAAMQG